MALRRLFTTVSERLGRCDTARALLGDEERTRPARAVSILVFAFLCTFLIDDGGVLYVLLPLASWGLLEVVGAFRPDQATKDGAVSRPTDGSFG